MLKDGQLYIAHSDNGNINLVGKMANRHGLIAGATGTGKTVTLQVLAETFSQAGVPDPLDCRRNVCRFRNSFLSLEKP